MAGLALAVWFGALLPCRPSLAQTDDATFVHVDAVASEPYARTVPVLGRVVPRRAGIVAARTAGTVEEIGVQVGDSVTDGAVIAVLDTDRLTAERNLRAAELAAAEAAFAGARAETGLRRQELARLEALRRSPAFNEARYQDQQQAVLMAEAGGNEAQASVTRARAHLQLADIALGDAAIRAPYAGVVTRRQAEVGAYVNLGDPVVTLVGTALPEIEADVPAAHLGGLAPGVTVRIDFDGQKLPAEVRALVPEENAMTRTRTVRFRSAFGGLTDLAANRAVTLLLPIGPVRPVTTVHKDAILHRGGETYVIRVTDGRADMRRVRLGEAIGSRFEVTEGLSTGDLVVTRGNERLIPGQPLRFDGGGNG
jgi:RND family efflux transporter MFP subunit